MFTGSGQPDAFVPPAVLFNQLQRCPLPRFHPFAPHVFRFRLFPSAHESSILNKPLALFGGRVAWSSLFLSGFKLPLNRQLSQKMPDFKAI
jgi:hypothetical protein